MTNPFEAAFDAMAMPVFAGQGLADAATYWPADGSGSYPCNVYVDKGSILSGDQSQVITDSVRITCFAADIPCVAIGGQFEIDGRTYTVDGIDNADESRTICIVKAGE